MSLTRVTFNLIKDALKNVKDLGASGNGVTNDTAALQAGGNYAYLPEGQYVTTTLLANYNSNQSGPGELSYFGTYYNNGFNSRIAANGNPQTALLRNNYNAGEGAVNKVTALALAAPQSIGTTTYVPLVLGRLQEGAGVFFPTISNTNIYATNQSKIMSFSGYVQFDVNSTGNVRAVALFKNNAFLHQINIRPVAVFQTSVPFNFVDECSSNDYYDLRVYHDASSSVSVVNALVNVKVEVEHPYYLGENRLLIFQGNWSTQEAAYGSYEALLDAVCQYDVLALSHIETVGVAPYPTWPVPPIIVATGQPIQDVGYPKLKRLIHDYKFRRPNGLVFGYVSAAIDCPTWDTAGNPTTNTWTSTTYPNFQLWCNLWLQDRELPIDGFFLDHYNAAFMSATNRDNVTSLVKKQYGKKVMVNITSPGAANVLWAADCDFLSYGDYLCLEGFYLDNGVNVLAATNATIAELEFSEARGLLLAAVNEEAATTPINNSSVNNVNGVALFNSFYKPGWCYQYGRVSYDTIGTPGIS